jgi:CheY-like chemotaxis protein
MMIESVRVQLQYKPKKSTNMANILVVDDETSLFTLLHTVLGRKRHEVVLADSGQKGIDMLFIGQAR